MNEKALNTTFFIYIHKFDATKYVLYIKVYRIELKVYYIIISNSSG